MKKCGLSFVLRSRCVLLALKLIAFSTTDAQDHPRWRIDDESTQCSKLLTNFSEADRALILEPLQAVSARPELKPVFAKVEELVNGSDRFMLQVKVCFYPSTFDLKLFTNHDGSTNWLLFSSEGFLQKPAKTTESTCTNSIVAGKVYEKVKMIPSAFSASHFMISDAEHVYLVVSDGERSSRFASYAPFDCGWVGCTNTLCKPILMSLSEVDTIQ